MRTIQINGVALAFVSVLALSAPAFAATTRTFYLQTVQWVSKKNPDQKKAVAKFGEVYGFAPNTLVVRQDDHVVIDIRNLESGGDDGHTFTLKAYGINKSLPPLSSVKISFTADKVGIFQFSCEFHKPWMSGELVVLPAK
ncbi:cupredoxin domain-containing protein [Acidiphilium sp. AL]|uniref:Cupredoxin domain-containing protein n=1 Tax=Acidiphilium iwatense TaxID=768198 RepID=A0ABS9E1J0_9PROT|nr:MULTISPECIES: cupredoxin domain-containing protein [Acidiphilium]MCF3948876.1 cupredoxin domain-containing protein [Acidiphilium iwatense]MCU4161661.1 cupredoxin domain-containing protein [Acidiphilium sp. AL]